MKTWIIAFTVSLGIFLASSVTSWAACGLAGGDKVGVMKTDPATGDLLVCKLNAGAYGWASAQGGGTASCGTQAHGTTWLTGLAVNGIACWDVELGVGGVPLESIVPYQNICINGVTQVQQHAQCACSGGGEYGCNSSHWAVLSY